MNKIVMTGLIIFACVFGISAQSPLKQDILVKGKWYNDEYSFTFNKNKTYKAFYTSGKTNGEMNGSFELEKTGILLKKGTVKGSFILSLMAGGTLQLTYIEDAQNPKSTRLLKDSGGLMTLWNDLSFVPEGQKIVLEPGKTPCISQGYKLQSTTDNVRVRKGPGTNYDYSQFTYKDVKSGEIKSFGSVLAGTNIRILARTQDKMKVNEWYNYWYFVEYKEPSGELLVYKTAWMFGEFINVAENKNRAITITSPQNEGAIYGAYTLDVAGEVTGSPVKMIIQIKNSYGNIVSETPVSDFDQKKGSFSYTLSKEQDDLYIGSNTVNVVAVYSDQKRVSRQVTFYLHESQGEMAKPMIYLYPVKEMEVSVQVKPLKGISVSIPEYDSGWKVIADPKGELKNIKDGKTYPYLFWESGEYPQNPLNEGFVVARGELKKFFTEKLTVLGLNAKEIGDFNEYWIPVLNKKPYYLIRFIPQDMFETQAPLTVSPHPDTVIRVFFDSTGLDKPVSIREQILTGKIRSGFTVVEWGGMRY